MKERKLHKVNGKIIYDYMEMNGLNERQFAKRCGITLYAFQEIMKGRGDFVIINFIKIALCLNVSLDELFKNLYECE